MYWFHNNIFFYPFLRYRVKGVYKFHQAFLLNQNFLLKYLMQIVFQKSFSSVGRNNGKFERKQKYMLYQIFMKSIGNWSYLVVIL